MPSQTHVNILKKDACREGGAMMTELVHTSKAKIHFTDGMLSFVFLPHLKEEQTAIKSMWTLMDCFKVLYFFFVTGAVFF